MELALGRDPILCRKYYKPYLDRYTKVLESTHGMVSRSAKFALKTDGLPIKDISDGVSRTCIVISHQSAYN